MSVGHVARIIDRAAPQFEQLESHVMGVGFPWTYSRRTTKDGGDDNPYLNGWAHLVYDQGKWYSAAHQSILGAVIDMMQACGEPMTEVFRIRFVLNTITHEPYLNGPHVDFFWPHRTALLYLNDSDGDTLIYDERWSEDGPAASTVAQTVAPMANRLVCFDGLRFHTGTTPTRTARRVVLNINYE
jgi:hypothetical protein